MQGRMVSVKYATAKSPTEMETAMATILLIGKKNTTKPAKKKNTER
jgi:hypothetical protein